MTLIIAVLTEQYVALASDRRTTWKRGTRITRQEDTDTKTFNLFGQFLMGFTGLARIDGWRIERWAGDILGGVPTEQYFSVLTNEIQATFDRLKVSGRQPHAFLAVGYAPSQPGGITTPLCITISNCLDDSNNFSTKALGPTFKMSVEPLGNRRHLIRSVGWPMRETTMKALAHRMRVVTRGEPANPSLSIGPLVMALRDTARISEKHVGEATLFASLPRSTVPSPGMATGQHIDYRRQAASLFLPEGAKPGEGTIYMPAIINPMIRMAGFRVYSGTAPKLADDLEGY